jgi:tetratricopeptide (TPR) repeat protein
LLAASPLPGQFHEEAQDELRLPPIERLDAEACDTVLSSELSRQATEAEARGDDAKAALLYRRAWRLCRQKALLLRAAELANRSGLNKEAADAARAVLQSDPNEVRALTTLANALLMQQRLEKAKEAATRAVAIEPDNSNSQLLLANIEYLLGDSTQAEQIFLKVLDAEPANENAAYMLGRVYYMENRVDYAMAQFQRALKVNPKSYKAWDNLALCYDAKGETGKAIGAFLEAIKLVEKDVPAYDWPYANLADLLLRRNEPQQAYQAATEAARRNPNSARNFYIGGKALWKLDRGDDALKWLERSAQLDPAYPDPLYLLGQVYVKLGDRDKGKEMLERFRVVKAKAPKTRR